MTDPNKPTVVASATNAAEAELIVQRLTAAGIHASVQRAFGTVEWGESGARWVYTDAADAERARELLGESAGISDEELARQAEEAAE
jgi:hypothetical protein